MNYLAHLFLAGDTAESLLGNLAGDFVKGPLHDRFSPAIRQGIVEHRKIDAFTDSHPAVAKFRHVIGVDHGHYSRVIADVFFDHFLAFRWKKWSDEPLTDFLDRVFTLLDPHQHAMPERLQRAYPRMRDGQWLCSYAGIDGIWTALYYLSKRFKREPRLEFATHLLIDQRRKLQKHFNEFFPEVIDYATTLRTES